MTNRIEKPNKAMTYDEWNAIGYSPYKGQKHTGRNEAGVCTFLPEQVGRKPSIDDLFRDVVRRNIAGLKKDMYYHD